MARIQRRGLGGQITGGGPGEVAAAEVEEGLIAFRDEDTVGESEGVVCLQAFRVQSGIEIGEAGDVLAVGLVPEFEEIMGGGAAAFDAGAMAGG